MEVLFITSNPVKILEAQKYCSNNNILIKQHTLDIDEIQSDDAVRVAIDKAKKAFEIINKPLIVSDNGWLIPCLNGFPGPYMKFMNKWLEPHDFLNLVSDKKDRTIMYQDIIVYIDEHEEKVITHETRGTLLTEVRGETGHAIDKVVTFSSSGESISEMKDRGGFALDEHTNAWHEFAKWFSQHESMKSL